MSRHARKNRHTHLVSLFAAAAFALLITLSAQQQAANVATANAVRSATSLAQYRRAPNLAKCPYKPGDRGYTNLKKACSTRSLIKKK